MSKEFKCFLVIPGSQLAIVAGPAYRNFHQDLPPPPFLDPAVDETTPPRSSSRSPGVLVIDVRSQRG